MRHCAAHHGGCGCMGLLDCVHDDKVERATEAIFTSDGWDQRARGSREDAEALAWRVLLAAYPEGRA